MLLVPKKVFFTNGVGTHKKELRSFELALRDAGIEKCNLVTVSSILPPDCKIVSRAKGLAELVPGMITFTVLARCCSNEPHRLIAASVGCAVPHKGFYGYLSEYHSYGETDEVAGNNAEDMAVAMLASTRGLDFDVDKSWAQQKEVYHISNKVVRAMNVTQSAIISPSANFTTVVAAAVFLF